MNNPTLRALVTAFVFLTRIPMPALNDYKAEDSGRALAYFPVVGLVIGFSLLLTTALLPLPPLVLAALLLTLWVFITGGLHIDGLGDSADGWLGGLGDKARTLEIMKDPRSGSAALMTVGCLLIVKFAALATLIEQQYYAALLLTPIIGRCIPPILFMSTPYVSKNGIAKDFIEHADKTMIAIVLAVTAVLCLLFLGFITTIVMVIISSTILYGLRNLMIRRLEGNTGDTTGAAVEIIEASVLVILCL